MRANKLRQLLNENKPSLGTQSLSIWPQVVEVLGQVGMYDYVEFAAQYAPFDMFALENFCRTTELYHLSSVIKVDLEPHRFLAQRAIGAGFQSVLFADCGTPEEVRQCISSVRAATPQDGGSYGAVSRRFAGIKDADEEYVQALRDIVVMIMIEKKSLVDRLDEVLEIEGIDMITWGGADYAMTIGRTGAFNDPDITAVRKRVIKASHARGIPVRVEIPTINEADYYIDLGVRHFSLGRDLRILTHWWRDGGEFMRDLYASL
jgi:4-hydroxy-2-oxoheptanedioate aldolase